MKIYVVFDDTNEKSEIITDIIGKKGFADVMVRKKRLEERCMECIREIFPDCVWRRVNSVFEFRTLAAEPAEPETKVLHIFSDHIITDAKAAALSLKKLLYIDEAYRINADNTTAALVFPDMTSYLAFCGKIDPDSGTKTAAADIRESFKADGIIDIGIFENFISYIMGTPDSRYFNALKGNDYIITKTSSNKKKIKSEYTYYHLLPDEMKFWFVMPFDYKEDKDSASYTMERLHITDLAVKWIHGSIGAEEFSELLNRYFFFFKARKSKKCSAEEYRHTAEQLYTKKVQTRLEDFKSTPEYAKIAALLEAGTGDTLDDITQKYFALKNKIEGRQKCPCISVIGHGDPCFSNTMYNRATKTLKFIDPKGALTEEELWTDPYYDLAKLSHSICGLYDFFNNALFDIKITSGLETKLEINFDNRIYKQIFREKLEEAGFDYHLVRIYEASLFLSMLPLHIDNPYKVFGFILNAKNILKELEADVQ